MKITLPSKVVIIACAAFLCCTGCGKKSSIVEPVVEEAFWERTMGPGGGIVFALTSNADGHLFAGMAPFGEIFRSTDDGGTWESVYESGTGYIVCLAVDASNRLLAGTSSSGVLRSANDGKSWVPIGSGLPTYTTGYRPIYALAAASNGTLFAATNDGVYRSLNDGATWTSVKSGLGCSWIQCIAIDSAGVVYAGTVDSADPFNHEDACGVYRSADNGDSWGPANNGLPSASSILSIVAYAGNHLMVSTYGGVFRSANGGNSWELRNSGIFQGLYIFSLAADANDQLKAAGPSGSVFYSADEGTSWHYIRTGCALFTSSCDIRILHIAPNGTVFAGTDGLGIYRSPDLTSPFERACNGLAHTYVRGMAVHPSGDIFAVTRHGRVQRSTDNGVIWELRDGSVPGTLFPDIHRDDDLRSILARANGDILLASYAGGIFLSVDAGSSWNQSNTGNPGSNATCLVEDGSTGYLYSGWRAGVYRSTTSGASWERASSGLYCPYVYSLAVRSSGLILAGSGTNDTYACGLFRSLNGGGSWDEIDFDEIGSQTLICILTAPQGEIYAGTDRGGVIASADSGITWQPANAGIESAHILCLAMDSSGRLYAGTKYGGAYRSTDRGASWEALSLGLKEDEVLSLIIAPDGHLLAGSDHHGVFRSREPVE